MIFLLYNLLFHLLYPLFIPHFLWRMRKRGGYRAHFGQRFGMFSAEERARLGRGGWVWIHAVSVGEINVALNVMRLWRAREPSVRFVLSHTTSTGRDVAARGVTAEDFLLYVPVDSPWIVRRVVQLIRPRLFILTESEFWPNLLLRMRREGVPVALVNGRISDRSFPRYHRVRAVTRAVFGLIDRLCMQSRLDAERMIALGAPAERVHMVSSAKYDLPPPPPGLAAGSRAALVAAGLPADAVVLMAGSTWEGEEAALCAMLTRLRAVEPRLRLLLAPRHAERAPAVIGAVRAAGLTLAARKPMEGFVNATAPDVFLLNTTGELMAFYAAADLVFVGKTLTQTGGQNFIEPALFDKPVLVGPNTQNFPQITRDFLEADAMIQVRDAAELENRLAALLRDPARAAELGSRAGDLVRRSAGAIDRTLDLLLPLARRD